MDQYIHDNTDDEIQPRRLHQRLPEGARRGPVNLTSSARCPAARRQAPADRTAHEPDAADRRHQLLDALPQRLAEPRLRRQAPARPSRPRCRAVSRRFRAATTDLNQPTTCRRSPTRPASTSASSSRAVPASTPSSPSGSPIPRCCGSCSASGRPRRCTSRPGTTRPATPRRSPTRRTVLVFPDLNADGEGRPADQPDHAPSRRSSLDRSSRSSRSSGSTETEGAAMGAVQLPDRRRAVHRAISGVLRSPHCKTWRQELQMRLGMASETKRTGGK
jgi:hypothetical protein